MGLDLDAKDEAVQLFPLGGEVLLVVIELRHDSLQQREQEAGVLQLGRLPLERIKTDVEEDVTTLACEGFGSQNLTAY